MLSAATSLNEAAAEDASGTIHVFDIMGQNQNENSIDRINAEFQTDRTNKAVTPKVPQRHFEGFNALFGDGHVKYRRWGSTRASEWTIQDD